MIPRYSRKQMTDIWEEQNRFEIWVKIEIAALEAMKKKIKVLKGPSEKEEKKVSFKTKRKNKMKKKIKKDA